MANYRSNKATANDLVAYSKSHKNKNFPLIITYLKESASQKLLSN